MNVANFYATLEPLPSGAMARFDELLQGAAMRKRIYRGTGKRDTPLLNTQLKCEIWKVIGDQKKPIDLINIYELLPKKVTRERGWKVHARNAVSLWSRRDWLHRIGRNRQYTYEIKRKI